MTHVELASLFNVTGMAVVLVVSLFVASRHPAPFFKHWTRASMAGTVGMAGNLAELATGSPAPLTLGVLALHFTTAWQFFQTAFPERDGVSSARAAPRSAGPSPLPASRGAPRGRRR